MRSGAKLFEKKTAAKNFILNIILTLINHQIKSQVIFLQKIFWDIHEIFLGKPNSRHDAADGEEDAEFLNIIHKVRVEPRKKYSEPITETQVRSCENNTKTQWPDLSFFEIHLKIVRSCHWVPVLFMRNMFSNENTLVSH